MAGTPLLPCGMTRPIRCFDLFPSVIQFECAGQPGLRIRFGSYPLSMPCRLESLDRMRPD
jgi:hypothetical protein